MTAKRRDTMPVWSPTPEQLRVAEYLASGHSQNRTMALTGTPQRTISDWWQQVPFQQLVAEMTARFISESTQDSVFAQTRALAQLVYHQALAGERSSDDPSVELARDFLAATEWRIRSGQQHKQFGS